MFIQNQILHVVLYIENTKIQNVRQAEYNTYTYNDEVKPTPGICEITVQAISYPFQKHLHEKDVSKYFISIL